MFFYCNSLSQGKGGAETIATNLTTEMAVRGHKIWVGYNGTNGKKPYYRQHNSISLVPWEKNKPFQHYQNRISQLGLDLFFAFYADRQLLDVRKFCCESIPFGMQECTNPERLCFNNWKNRTGRKMHSTWERELIASSATRIRMVMHGYEKSFPPYVRQNVRSFPNPAPHVLRIAKPAGYPNGIKKIITVGGLKINKNLPLLIKAFSRLCAKFPEWEIHNYGMLIDDKKKYHREILELISAHHIERKIFFHGPTDDIFSEYAQSHIHVIPSLSEGCPTCILEAMAHGLPSVGIENCPGTNELIRDGIDGLLVQNDNTGEKLAEGLATLMNSPHLRESLGKQALDAAKKYQAKDTYDQWEKMFYEMAAYKNDPERLLREQIAVDKERALHMARCRQKIFQQDYK